MIAIVLIIFSISEVYPNETKEYFDGSLKDGITKEDWQKVLKDVNLALGVFPDDELYLKIKAGAYWNVGNYDDAIKTYEYLIKIYPAPNHKANLEEIKTHKAEHEYALRNIENVDSNDWDMGDVVPLYLNTIYMQQKINKSYRLIGKFALQDMALTHSRAEDLFLLNSAKLGEQERREAVQKFNDNPILTKLKQANVFQVKGELKKARELYEEVLQADPDNIDAQMGMGYSKFSERDFKVAREMFVKIYEKYPDYTDAKIAISNSYGADARYLNALEVLDGLPDTNKTRYLRGLIYGEIDMPNSSLDVLKGDDSERSNELKDSIYRKKSPRLIPDYSFLNQTLADRFRLNSYKTGVKLQEGFRGNVFGYFSYERVHLGSGNIGNRIFTTNTNDINLTFFGRPKRRLEFQTDIGARFFRLGTDGSPSGAMLTTDSWVKYYFSDTLDVQLGFSRENLEESFLSASGAFVAPNVFAGRVSDNRLYLNINQRLPKSSYAYFNGSLGLREGKSLPNNIYADSLLGVGKVVYENYKNRFFNIMAVDLATYNAGFRCDVLDEFGSDALFGVYFSPPYFNANSLSLRLEGYNYAIRLRYGIKAFVASQSATRAQTNTQTGVCFAPYISWAPNERLTLNAVFHYSNFADVQKYYAMFQLQIKLYKNKK